MTLRSTLSSLSLLLILNVTPKNLCAHPRTFAHLVKAITELIFNMDLKSTIVVPIVLETELKMDHQTLDCSSRLRAEAHHTPVCSPQWAVCFGVRTGLWLPIVSGLGFIIPNFSVSTFTEEYIPRNPDLKKAKINYSDSTSYRRDTGRVATSVLWNALLWNQIHAGCR